MTICIVCEERDCQTVHAAEEIRAVTVNYCHFCLEVDCKQKHTLEELKNPKAPTPEIVRDALRICIAYSKLLKWG